LIWILKTTWILFYPHLKPVLVQLGYVEQHQMQAAIEKELDWVWMLNYILLCHQHNNETLHF